MKKTEKPPKDREIELKIKDCLIKRRYRQSLHAFERIDKRKVSFQDVLFVLETGRREEAKDAFDEAFKNWKYSIRGNTLENVDIRIIVTLNESNVVIITVVNLNIKEDL